MVSPPVPLLLAAGSAAGGLTTVALSVVAWQRRDVPAAKPFSALMVAASVWSFGYAGTLVLDGPFVTRLLLVVATLGTTQVAPLGVVFVLRYAGLDRYVRPSTLAALWAVPLAYAGLVVTSSVHDVLGAVEHVALGQTTVPVLERGPIYWLATASGFAEALVAIAILIWFLVGARTVYRRQTAAILLGSLFPFVGSAVTVFGAGASGVDATPITFAFGSVLIGWVLLADSFTSLSPLASDVLVEELPDPVLLLDERGVVVDYNAAAERAFGSDLSTGTEVETLAPGLGEEGGTDGLLSRSTPDGSDVTFDPQMTAISDGRGDRRGRLVILRNVTVQQRRLDRVESLQAVTEAFIDATIDDEVAEITVSFVNRILDRDIAVVFLPTSDGDALRPAAISEALAETVEDEAPNLPRSGVLFTQYRRGEADTRSVPPGEWATFDQFEAGPTHALALPMGERGLLCIGAPPDGYPAGDRQFARILAGAAEAALDRVAREQELRENRRLIRQRTEQLDFLNGVLRHNIRNGMQVIDSNVDLLAGHVDDEGQPHLDRIRDRSRELATLTEKIRSITETLTADEAEQLYAIDLELALREAVEAVRTESPTVTIDVTVTAETTVLANELLADVFENVLQNAIEHDDDPPTTIDIDVVDVGEWVQVHVADDGPGVSEHLKESLFERDVRISQTAHGFGLYFVAVMMDLYGGDVWFEDNDPRGAIAVLEFQQALTDGS